MTQHIANRFDFATNVAGVLRLIEKPDLYIKFREYLDRPDLFYYNDSSDQTYALRLTISALNELYKDGPSSFKDMSIEKFDSSISKHMPEEKQRTALLTWFNLWRKDENILKKKSDDGCFSVFLDYLKILQVVKYAPDFNKSYQIGDAAKTSEYMQKIVHGISKLSNDVEVRVYDAAKAFMEIKRPIDHLSDKTFYLGCEPLDHTVGGFHQETLNVFISTTGGGKSALCHHIIRQCVEKKIYAFVACVEDREKSFTYKTLAAITGIEMFRLKNNINSLTSLEISKLEDAVKKINEYIHVEFIYGESVEFIHKRMLEYDTECKARNRENCIPVVNVVDYTGHIVAKSVGDKTYEKVRNAYAARKDFALKNRKICFDFAQVNREGNKRLNDDRKALTHANLAGAYDLSQVCDNIISINRSEIDVMENFATLYLAKCRDGESEKAFRVKTDFKKYRYEMEQAEWTNANKEQAERYESERKSLKN